MQQGLASTENELLLGNYFGNYFGQGCASSCCNLSYKHSQLNHCQCSCDSTVLRWFRCKTSLQATKHKLANRSQTLNLRMGTHQTCATQQGSPGSVLSWFVHGTFQAVPCFPFWKEFFCDCKTFIHCHPSLPLPLPKTPPSWPPKLAPADLSTVLCTTIHDHVAVYENPGLRKPGVSQLPQTQ